MTTNQLTPTSSFAQSFGTPATTLMSRSSEAGILSARSLSKLKNWLISIDRDSDGFYQRHVTQIWVGIYTEIVVIVGLASRGVWLFGL